MMKGIHPKTYYLIFLLFVIFYGLSAKNVFAQDSPSVLYVPLIGLTSIPKPSALPNEGGYVTYKYAVKNFLNEVALNDIDVVDDKCSPIKFMEGDDNDNSWLDADETWRYTCTTKLSKTTQSTAIATGKANNMTATHKAYAMVVVGSHTPPPLISIINITKVAYPLSLPPEGGSITFTYKVNNPGEVALSNVTVTDDKCNAVSGRLGDRNSNNLLDVNEVWIYHCTTTLTETTTNTVTVKGSANGFEAVGDATITVQVENPLTQVIPSFPNAGKIVTYKNILWGALLGVLTTLLIIFVRTRKSKTRKFRGKK